MKFVDRLFYMMVFKELSVNYDFGNEFRWAAMSACSSGGWFCRPRTNCLWLVSFIVFLQNMKFFNISIEFKWFLQKNIQENISIFFTKYSPSNFSERVARGERRRMPGEHRVHAAGQVIFPRERPDSHSFAVSFWNCCIIIIISCISVDLVFKFLFLQQASNVFKRYKSRVSYSSYEKPYYDYFADQPLHQWSQNARAPMNILNRETNCSGRCLLSTGNSTFHFN